MQFNFISILIVWCQVCINDSIQCAHDFDEISPKLIRLTLDNLEFVVRVEL
jgi:hypothetical protein